MPRKTVPASAEHFYHIAVRVNHHKWFEIPIEKVWGIFERQLFFLSHAFHCDILSAVLMNNHFHLIIKFSAGNMSSAMNYFIRELSREISNEKDGLNHKFVSRYMRCLIVNERYLRHCYKYVYRNPVDAGIVDKVEDYKYSTLRMKIGLDHQIIPICEDSFLFESCLEDHLDWLNSTPKIENKISVQLALRRAVYSLPNYKNKSNPLDIIEY